MVDERARELVRSKAMVKKYKPRRESLSPARKVLLQQEENHAEELEGKLRDEIAAAWMAGKFYFRSRPIKPRDQAAAFGPALGAVAAQVLPDLYRYFVSTSIEPTELLQLVATDLSGPSPKFMPGELGILELDSGRYVAACGGVVPRRMQEHIEAEEGLTGGTLLGHFGGPPYGYSVGVVKACVAGLLRREGADSARRRDRDHCLP